MKKQKETSQGQDGKIPDLNPKPGSKDPRSLLDNCDKTQNDYSYFKTLSPEEMEIEKDLLIDLTIKKENLEEEKKEFMVDFKSRFDPVKSDLKNSSRIVATGKKEVQEEVYLFFNRKDRTTDIYNSEGVFLGSRPLTTDELQMNFSYADK